VAKIDLDLGEWRLSRQLFPSFRPAAAQLTNRGNGKVCFMKTKTSPRTNAMTLSPLRHAFLLIPLVLACFAVSPQARAGCQQGCDIAHNNTFLGDDALLNNTGFFNTAIGYHALHNNTSSSNTAIGPNALASNAGFG